MVRWELGGGHGLGNRDRQRLKVARREPFLDVAGSDELAASSFEGDLPGRRRADEDEVRRRRDGLPSTAAETGIVGEPPEQSMRVEEKPHSMPNASARSGGSSSKSGAISIWPASKPGVRGSDDAS